jgi:hypothetical protein
MHERVTGRPSDASNSSGFARQSKPTQGIACAAALAVPIVAVADIFERP